MRERGAVGFGAALVLLLLLGAALFLSPPILLGAAVAAAVLPVWCWRSGLPRSRTILAAWPALHLLLLASGSLASPLIPLVAFWAFALALEGAPFTAAAAGIAAMIPALQAAGGDVPAAAALLRYGLLLGGAIGGTRLWPGARDRYAAEGQGSEGAPLPLPAIAPREREVLRQALEVVRLATDAHEAALWRADEDGAHARLVACASLPGQPGGAEALSLAGHPFSWALLEGAHFRLERNRQPLPSSWAAEMLLLPVDPPRDLLALAYSAGAPPGAEGAAAVAGAHLQGLAALLRGNERAGRLAKRLAALRDALRLLPGQLDPEALAAGLGEAALAGTGAEGGAMVLWDPERNDGRILWMRGGPAESGRTDRVGEGESRLALAAKHGVVLPFEDLRRERDVRPLLFRSERWETAPRSAVLVPLAAQGQTLGVLAVWHSASDRFGAAETAFLDDLRTLAPDPLHSASRYQALDRRASTDALTGLPNRAAFDARLAAAANHFARYARPFALIVADVDHFKRFNDSWGHEAGDAVLRQVGATLRGVLRDVDHPARLGGEEFVVLLPETGLGHGMEAAERIRERMERAPLLWNGRPLTITASFGVAACPDTLADPAELLAAADAALYRSKAAGRNRVTAASPVAPLPPRR